MSAGSPRVSADFPSGSAKFPCVSVTAQAEKRSLWRVLLAGGCVFSSLFLTLLSGCTSGDGVTETRFNQDDTIEVAVTASADLGVPVTGDLHSTTGTVVIGSIEVDPGSGPVGTEHDVTLRLLPDFADNVGRAEFETQSDSRGSETIALIQDSADHGLWWRQVTSVGDPGEERVDRFTFRLWQVTITVSGDGDTPTIDTDTDTDETGLPPFPSDTNVGGTTFGGSP